MSSDIILPLWNGRFFHKLTPCFSTKKQPHHWRIASLNRLSFILVFYFSIFLYSSKISDILSMLYRGMFVIQSCCLKSDMDVLTAYFGLYLSQKAFRLLAFKFSHIFDLSRIFGNVSHIFGLSRIFGNVPQILPFLVFLWYVFNLCKLVMSHILALSSLLSHIDLSLDCYVN